MKCSPRGDFRPKKRLKRRNKYKKCLEEPWIFQNDILDILAIHNLWLKKEFIDQRRYLIKRENCRKLQNRGRRKTWHILETSKKTFQVLCMYAMISKWKNFEGRKYGKTPCVSKFHRKATISDVHYTYKDPPNNRNGKRKKIGFPERKLTVEKVERKIVYKDGKKENCL